MKYFSNTGLTGSGKGACLKRCTIVHRILWLLILSLVAIPAVLSADFWEKKDYSEWKQRDCIKMLQDSPWAKTHRLSKAGLFSGNADSAAEEPYIQYNIRLRSALPVRQATVRLSQIANKYDDLSAEQKQQFDKGAEGFLTTQYADIVIFHVEYSTNMYTQDLNFAKYWQTQTTDILKNSTFLYGTGGVKIPLLQYNVGQGAKREFQLIFPREYEGKPVITPEDKSLKLEFDCPSIGGIDGGRALIEFKVKNMVMDGKVIF